MRDAATAVEGDGGPESAHNESLIQSIVRAHGWIQSLQNGAYETIEQLAEANSLHPKVVRQALRLAFLSPEVTSTILESRQLKELALAQIQKLFPLSWPEHRRLLG
jgi:site-specific DNA recombinase